MYFALFLPPPVENIC